MRRSLIVSLLVAFCVFCALAGASLAVYESRDILQDTKFRMHYASPGTVRPSLTGESGEEKIVTADEKIVVYTITKDESKPNKEADLYLATEIFNTESYLPLANDVKGFNSNDTIRLHLSGNGGYVEGYFYIVNVLKDTGAKIVPVVEGSVASAHAFLALSFDNKPVLNSTMGYMYFHSVSGTDEEQNLCKEASGTDRGYSAKQKCIENTITTSKVYNDYIYTTIDKYTTEEERGRMKQGRDVIVPFSEFKKRLTNG